MTEIIRTNLIKAPPHNVYLFQPQYSATINGRRQYWLPYSVGCLWSYASQYPDITNNYKLCGLIFRRENLDLLFEKFDKHPPGVCGFSVYAWNEQYCLYIAEAIKQKYPNCVIVFGGPQTNLSLLNHSFINSIVLAEGEESFTKLLLDNLSGEGIQQIYDKSRLADLEIPSPYLTGLFDKLIKENPDYVWSTVIETNRGCPYACTFCDWGSLTYSKVKKFNLGRVKEELEWIQSNPVVFITNADANFGMYKDRDLEIAKMIKQASDQGSVQSVAITYAKNSYESMFEIAEILKDISRGLTVSVQSMTDETLEAIKRKNMKINDISKMMSLSNELGVPTYTEMILGLPLESMESWKEGITNLLEAGQHYQIDVYFCILLRNSELNSQQSRLEYKIETVTAYDYVSFTELASDEVVLPEEFEIVTSTKDMSRDEIVESYLYSWMIIHFHTTGYTQQYAKYCRHVLGISYRKFYDKMFEMISDDPIINGHYKDIEDYVIDFLTTGMIKNNELKAVHLGSISAPILNSMKHNLIALGKQCFAYFSSDSKDIEWLDQIQQATVYDDSMIDYTILETPMDIQTWETKRTKYRISIPIARNSKRNLAPASTMRNLGFYKNVIEEIK